jgi:hypothetical protein
MTTLVRRSSARNSGAGSWKFSAASITCSIPLLFADAHPAHQVGQALVARLVAVDEALDGDERLAGVGDLDAVGVDFDHDRGAALGEVLVDQGVGDQFADDDFRQ